MLHKYTLESLQSTTTIGMGKEIKKKSKTVEKKVSTVEKKVSICHFGLEVLLCMTLG